ncbi:MAG: ATPase, T2SS/T4P/T4SS family [archaeon]|nr:ATPase, T2SS/T4P/T4SS family [archaeon]
MQFKVLEGIEEKDALKNCPNQLSSFNAFKCLDCKTHDCFFVCPEKAIFETAKNVFAIDYDVCTKCGDCVKACPHDAIEIVEGFPKKCDMCAKNNFSQLCVNESNGLIQITKSFEETQRIEELMDFVVFEVKEKEIARKLRERSKYEIIELKNSEKMLMLKQSELSLEEAQLVSEFLSRLRKQTETIETKEIVEEFRNFLQEKLIELEEKQFEELLELIQQSIRGFGVVSTLLNSAEIEEIALIGLGKDKPLKVFEKDFGWVNVNAYFAKETSVKDLINKMSRGIGRRITLQNPKLNAVLPNGERLNACLEPVSFSGPTFTIRKFRETPFTPIDLIENKTVSSDAMAFLWMALQTDANILIAGNTGSGKTTLLNALFGFVPKNERIIVVEETPEINLPHKHAIKLNTVENLEIGMQELITNTLRMRPDRIIVGEIRTKEEVKAFVDTMLAGQGKASYASFHALNAKECITRLKNFGINEMDISAIDLIIVQKRWSKIGKESVLERKIVEITEPLLGEAGIRLNCLFEFDFGKNKLLKKNNSKRFSAKFLQSFGLKESKIEKELKKRKKLLESVASKKLSIKEFNEFAGEMNNAKN